MNSPKLPSPPPHPPHHPHTEGENPFQPSHHSSSSSGSTNRGIVSTTTRSPKKNTNDTPPSKVLILYTGGTMGMDVDAAGSLAPKRGYLTDKIMHMEELQSPSMPDTYIKEYEHLMDSAAMGHKEWCQIACDIREEYYNYDGFVVIMGTDTMAYAATALSFMLESLGKTVVFTGSQIPFVEVYNDARRNLIASIIFASNQDFCEVCLFFAEKLLRGNRSTKMNSFSLAAFETPNFPPLATLGVNVELRKDLAIQPPHAPFKVFLSMNTNVVVFKLIPQFCDEPLRTLVMESKSIKAIVIELYGTGNAPNEKKGLLEVLELARDKGIIVVAVSQCYKGSVVLGKYAVGNELRRLGVISGGDQTTECVAIKLAYLMGKLDTSTGNGDEGNGDKEDGVRNGVSIRNQIGKLMEVNLRGEVSPVAKYETTIFQRNCLSKL